MKDLKTQVVRAGFVRVAVQAANFVLRIGALVVLARLMQPEDFGLVAMVTAVTGVLGKFGDFGLSTVTIQRATITDEQRSTLFWLNLMVGAILCALSVVIAPVLAAFYREPRLFWVTVALASGFVFTATAAPHSALLQRQLRFSALALIDIMSLVASIAVGVGMAMAHYGYWALVGMSITMPACSSVCLWLTTGWVPGRPRRGLEIRSMLRFGGAVTMNMFVVCIAYNIDKVLLGRVWGAGALGIYERATQLINFPTDNLNSAVGGVALPALSRLQDDPERRKSYFLKGYSLVLAMTVPLTAACAMFADDIIQVLLGAKWKDAATIFRLLAPTVLILALINPLGWLLYATGQVGRSLRISLVIAPLVITAYFIGLPYGPTGVAFAYSAAMILWVVPHIAWCIHGTTISSRDIIQSISKPISSAALATAVAFAVNHVFSSDLLSPFPRLVLECSVLFGSYLWMLLYVFGHKAFYMDLLRTLRTPPSVG